MKKLALLSALVLSLAFVSCDEILDKPIPISQLPYDAQEFLHTHFTGVDVLYINKDVDGFELTYEVLLANYTEIVFYKRGDWKKVDCNLSAVPLAIIPQPIVDYVTAHFPGAWITEIEKDSDFLHLHYDVELNTGLDIKFNKHFQVIEID